MAEKKERKSKRKEDLKISNFSRETTVLFETKQFKKKHNTKGSSCFIIVDYITRPTVSHKDYLLLTPCNQ